MSRNVAMSINIRWITNFGILWTQRENNQWEIKKQWLFENLDKAYFCKFVEFFFFHY